MSDTSQGPGWWLAADGKWYAPEFRAPIRQTVPVPPAPPAQFAPVPPMSPGRATRSRSWLWVSLSALMVVVVFAVVLSSILVVRSRSSASSAESSDFIAVMNDVTDAEDYSAADLEVFWQTFEAANEEADAAPDSRRQEIVDQWLVDVRQQTGEFEQQLRGTTTSLRELQLPEGSTADQVRNAALRHYGTWERYTNLLPGIAEDWTNDTETDLDFSDYIDEQIPEIVTEIEDSFLNLCSIMSNGQPDNGNYEETISDICQLPDADVKTV